MYTFSVVYNNVIFFGFSRPATKMLRLKEKGYQIEQQDMTARLEAGDLAEVLDGPFKGEEVEVYYTEEEAYVIVSVEGLSSNYKVNLPREVLKLKKKNKDRDKSLL
jgi:transcription antitermination factor NusG